MSIRADVEDRLLSDLQRGVPVSHDAIVGITRSLTILTDEAWSLWDKVDQWFIVKVFGLKIIDLRPKVIEYLEKVFGKRK